MGGLKLLILAAMFGVVICGCKKEEGGAETTQTIEKEETGKEASMGITIQWVVHIR